MLWNSSDLQNLYGLCWNMKLTLNLRNMEVGQRSSRIAERPAGTSRHSFHVLLFLSSLVQGMLLTHRTIWRPCFRLTRPLWKDRNRSVRHARHCQALRCQVLNHGRWCLFCANLREPTAPHIDTFSLYLRWNDLHVEGFDLDRHQGRNPRSGTVSFQFRRRNSNSQWRGVLYMKAHRVRSLHIWQGYYQIFYA